MMTMMLRVVPLLLLLCAAAAAAQAPAQKEPAIEKLGASTFRIGRMIVDTAKREVSVPGTVNAPSTLEFVANTPDGMRAYETAFTLDSSAISFNAALLLIDLDPARSKPSKFQFDPSTPEGDPVEIEVEWQDGGRKRRDKIEEFLFDQRTKKTLPSGPWVYTGSTWFETYDERKRAFAAQVEGVLIGLMHGPQALIDNPRNDAVGGYGRIILNPQLNLAEKTPITLIVRALPLPAKQKR